MSSCSAKAQSACGLSVVSSGLGRAHLVFNALISDAALRLGSHVLLVYTSFLSRVALGEEERGSLTTTKLGDTLIDRVGDVVLEDSGLEGRGMS